MNRRNFLVHVPLVAGGVALVDLEGCAAGDAVVNILQLMEPGVDGILPIVELADPAIGAAVQVALGIFDGGVATVITLYKNYEASLTANGGTSPSLLQQFESGMSTLNTDVLAILKAAQVKDPLHQTVIADIISAVTTEIGTIVGIFSPTVATSNPSVGVRVTVMTPPSQAHLQAELVAFKARMAAVLSRQTGNVALDNETAALAKAYK
jgi:hypothetical protein